jgi:hypothetical protein
MQVRLHRRANVATHRIGLPQRICSIAVCRCLAPGSVHCRPYFHPSIHPSTIHQCTSTPTHVLHPSIYHLPYGPSTPHLDTLHPSIYHLPYGPSTPHMDTLHPSIHPSIYHLPYGPSAPYIFSIHRLNMSSKAGQVRLYHAARIAPSRQWSHHRRSHASHRATSAYTLHCGM